MNTLANIRIGWLASRNMNRFIAKALLAYDKTSEKKGKFLFTFGLSYQPWKGTSFDIGKIPAAATHMVAQPVTAWGHFQFTAETKVPGPWLAVKATQKFGDVTVVSSASQTDAGIQPSMYISVDNKTVGSIAAAGVYAPDTREFAWWISWNKQFHNKSSIFVILWGSPHNVALSSMFTAKNSIGIFVDGSYDFDTHTIPAAQAGIIKALDWPVNAKLGAGYDPINNSFQWVLFLNISR